MDMYIFHLFQHDSIYIYMYVYIYIYIHICTYSIHTRSYKYNHTKLYRYLLNIVRFIISLWHVSVYIYIYIGILSCINPNIQVCICWGRCQHVCTQQIIVELVVFVGELLLCNVHVIIIFSIYAQTPSCSKSQKTWVLRLILSSMQIFLLSSCQIYIYISKVSICITGQNSWYFPAGHHWKNQQLKGLRFRWCEPIKKPGLNHSKPTTKKSLCKPDGGSKDLFHFDTYRWMLQLDAFDAFSRRAFGKGIPEDAKHPRSYAHLGSSSEGSQTTYRLCPGKYRLCAGKYMISLFLLPINPSNIVYYDNTRS